MPIFLGTMKQCTPARILLAVASATMRLGLVSLIVSTCLESPCSVALSRYLMIALVGLIVLLVLPSGSFLRSEENCAAADGWMIDVM